MTHPNIIVTRHGGATEWIRSQVRDPIALTLAHIDSTAWQRLRQLAAGRPVNVFGVLPLYWLLRLESQGMRCWALDVEMPADRRGTEITAVELRSLGARLRRVRVRSVALWPSVKP